MLFPYYLSRNVHKIVGVDISQAMIEVAKGKFSDSRIYLIAADIEELDLNEKFERCIVFNAFPHFFNPASLISCLSNKIKDRGRLTIAHDMSRSELDAHHKNHANNVSIKLISETELAEMLSIYFNVDVVISNDDMYVVSGVKK